MGLIMPDKFTDLDQASNGHAGPVTAQAQLTYNAGSRLPRVKYIQQHILSQSRMNSQQRQHTLIFPLGNHVLITAFMWGPGKTLRPLA